MGFYKRYSGFGLEARGIPTGLTPAGSSAPAPGSPAPVGPVVPAVAPRFPATPTGIETFIPRAPARQAVIPGMFDTKTAASLTSNLPAIPIRSASIPPLAPGPATPANIRPTGQTMFPTTTSSLRIPPSLKISDAAATRANVSDAKADILAQAAKDKEAAANEAAFQASKANADAAVKAAAAQAQADAARAAQNAMAAQLKAQADADAARIAAAKASADIAAAEQAQIFQQSSGGGGPVPSQAWDQPNDIFYPEAQMTPDMITGGLVLPPGMIASSGTPTQAAVKTRSPLLAAAGAGAAGFFVGGPLGAAVGAAAGFLLGKLSSAHTPAAPPPPPALKGFYRR